MRLAFANLIVTLLASVVCMHVYAANWREITRSSTAIILLDYDSIAPRGQYIRAWFMHDHLQPQKTKSYPYKEYRSTKQLHVFNCNEKTSATIQVVDYEGDTGVGETVDTWSIDIKTAHFSDVVPDSIGEEMLRIACRRAPKQKPQGQAPAVAPSKSK